jgi:hypothetical protein
MFSGPFVNDLKLVKPLAYEMYLYILILEFLNTNSNGKMSCTSLTFQLLITSITISLFFIKFTMSFQEARFESYRECFGTYDISNVRERLSP